jgi:hypothetical protein
MVEFIFPFECGGPGRLCSGNPQIMSLLLWRIELRALNGRTSRLCPGDLLVPNEAR